MRDRILESIFLDTELWTEVIEHGVNKNIPHHYLEELADPNRRADICISIGQGNYKIEAPHTGYRKKDDGGERMFLANAPQDRLLLNAIYKWLSRNESNLIHPSCKSYQSGIGIGKIVKEISNKIRSYPHINQIIGRKFDISKYFESVRRADIHKVFDTVEADFGRSSIIDLLRDYYDSDIYYDSREKKTVDKYQGIKQGCAVSAWLANVLLYAIDKELSGKKGLYVRYSDDIIYIGEDYEEVTAILNDKLSLMGLQINENKITDLRPNEYFTFLGFDLHNSDITLSRKWVKHFQFEIDKRTIKDPTLIKKIRGIYKSDPKDRESQLIDVLEKTVRKVTKYLLYGNGKYSWAMEVLSTVNNKHDIEQLSLYCLDALRATYTGHTHIGGLGKSYKQGIQRGKGRNVTSNRLSTKHLENKSENHSLYQGFASLLAIHKAISNKWLVRTLAINLIDRRRHRKYGVIKNDSSVPKDKDLIISQLENLYELYLQSQPNGNDINRFYAYQLEDISLEMLISGLNRESTLKDLETFLIENVDFNSLVDNNEDMWFWQSATFPQLVLLRQWFT